MMSAREFNDVVCKGVHYSPAWIDGGDRTVIQFVGVDTSRRDVARIYAGDLDKACGEMNALLKRIQRVEEELATQKQCADTYFDELVEARQNDTAAVKTKEQAERERDELKVLNERMSEGNALLLAENASLGVEVGRMAAENASLRQQCKPVVGVSDPSVSRHEINVSIDDAGVREAIEQCRVTAVVLEPCGPNLHLLQAWSNEVEALENEISRLLKLKRKWKRIAKRLGRELDAMIPDAGGP